MARKPGTKPMVPTQDQREMVTRLASVGTRQDVIARILKISIDTLARHFRAELDCGVEEANAQVAATLFDKARSGDTGAIVWWEKTRAGKREISRLEHSGIDGGPIPLKDMSGYSDEQLELLTKAAVLLAGSAGGDGDESEAAAR